MKSNCIALNGNLIHFFLLFGPLNIRIVIPIFVRGHFFTLKALGFMPSVSAPWANTACPEGIPGSATIWLTHPAVFRLRMPCAQRTENFRIFHFILIMIRKQSRNLMDLWEIIKITIPVSSANT